MSLPTPDADSITQRRLLAQTARHDLDDYRRAKTMGTPDIDRLKQLARARSKINRLIRLEGLDERDDPDGPSGLFAVIIKEERRP